MTIIRDISFVFLLLSCTMNIKAQEVSYVKTTTMTSDSSGIVTTEYVDGLGRISQCNLKNASPGGGDLVTLQEYDLNGRESKAWLPASMNSGGLSCGIDEFKQNAASAYGDSSPYSLIQYENTPLNRTTMEIGPGASWHNANKGVETAYTTNSAVNPCRRYESSANGDSFWLNNNWDNGELDVTVSTDEDGNKSVVFKDMRGLVVLHRLIDVTNGNLQYDTYYVYDNYGNLSFVLPPMASDRLSTQGVIWDENNQVVADYCYCYKYDHRNLCISKKLPGCEEVLMRYDKAHQLIFSQDGNQRSANKWHFSLYDELGRPAVEGLCSEEQLPSIANTWTTVYYIGYDPVFISNDFALGYDLDLSLNNIELFSVNYYDSYDFLSIFAGHSDSLQFRPMNGYGEKYNGNGNNSSRGLLTGTVTRVLGDSTLLVKSIFYDAHDNIIQTHESNALNGFDHFYTEVSFTGKPLKVMHVHETADTAITDVYQYTYDNMERPLTTTVSRNGGTSVTLASNAYNSLGQLSERSLGGHANGVVVYTYNVRGWTQSISSTHFSQTLHYDDAISGATPYYNGNISALEWSSRDAIYANNPTTQHYTFDYDGLNRLMAAHHSVTNAYGLNGQLMINSNQARDYSTNYTYDLNSNITSLNRKGVSGRYPMYARTVWEYDDIDRLTLTYEGNQLRKVTDQCENLTYAGAMDFKDGADMTTEYEWDANGNMTRDRNKGIWDIRYNEINLPERIMYMDGHVVRYTYAADGRKLQVKYIESNIGVLEPTPINVGGNSPMGLRGGILPDIPIDTINIPFPVETTVLTMDYCGNHVYRNGELERTMNDYGYYADSTYYYFIKDYQGNVRAVIDQSGVLKEINNYYPYGGLMGAASAGVQPNKYSSQELDRQNGIDWYDFEARYQDPMLPMFTTQDPLAEQTPDISPYAYCAGNPIRYIDPSGLGWIELDNRYFYNSMISSQDKATELYGNNANYLFNEGRLYATDQSYSYDLEAGGHIRNSYTGEIVSGEITTPAGSILVNDNLYYEQKYLDFYGKLSNSNNIFAIYAYSSANDAYMLLQILSLGLFDKKHYTNPLTGSYSYQNLDGTPRYNATDAIPGIALTLFPVDMATPEGLKALSKMNAAQFSHTFKGNLSRLKPAERGAMNKTINKEIDYINGYVGKGKPVIKLEQLYNTYK